MTGSGPPDDGSLRPKIGRRVRRNQADVPSVYVRLSRTAPRPAGAGGRRRSAPNRPGRIAVREPHALSRRCVIKSRYVSMTGSGRKLAARHLVYLERDGVERDGSPGRVYGADEGFSADEVRERIPEEKRQFRFIVSPQDGAQVDLTAFARQVMRQVEKDIGRRLVWAAVNHHDTDNPHVHIVVRGVDRDGDEFWIDRGYLAHGMRWRAQEILTRELGRRLERDLSWDRATEVSREGFTEIDRALAEHASPDGSVRVARLLAAPEGERLACLDRLQVLEEMELATKESAGAWRLIDNWRVILTQRGEDLDAQRRLRALVGQDASRFQVLRPDNPLPVTDAVVVGMGLHDELSGDMFAAIRTVGGAGYYLRVPAQIAETLKEGDGLRVGFEVEPWLKPADRILARFAQENGGMYDPARHQRALEALAPRLSQQPVPTPVDRVAANIRRLERLERYRLVSRLPDGRWQVCADLLQQLANREQTHPQRRFRFERVAGPERARMPPNRPDPASEREALARTLSRQSGFTYVANPSEFRGRLEACAPTPGRREYVGIVDSRRGRFTVLPKPQGAERLEGRPVHLRRDPDGRLSFQIVREISR